MDEGQKRSAEQEKRKAIAELKKRGVSETVIENLRRIALGLNVAVYVIGFCSFLIVDPNHLLTWALLRCPGRRLCWSPNICPIAGLGVRGYGIQPDLSLALILPGLFLSLQVLRAIHPVGWQGPLMLTFSGSALLVGVAYWVDPWLKGHRGTALLLLLVCCGSGYGAGMQVNALRDGSTPEIYRVLVTGKHVSHGKSTNYHLELAQWGPNDREQDITVSSNRYARTKIGGTVCMVLRSGALGVAWSELGECE